MTTKKPGPGGSAKRRPPRSAEIDMLEAASRERDVRDLAQFRRMALDKARDAGEAFAHGEAAIGAQLMGLAEYAMNRALEAATRAYVQQQAKVRYRQKLNPGGRPKAADLGLLWLEQYEAKGRTSRSATALEKWEDIADAHREKSGKAYPVAYIRKEASNAKRRRQAQEKGTFR